MKQILLIILLCWGVFTKAQTIDTAQLNHQTDSIRIGLQHIKQLFIDGTINAQEYQAMREKFLGISAPPAPTQPIIIQQSTPVTPPTKQQIANLGLEEQRARNTGRPCLAFGALLTFTGTVTLVASIEIAKSEARSQGYIYNANQLGGGVVAGIVLMCASAPFWIAGGVEIGKANDFRRRLNGTAMNIQFSPMAIALNF